MVITIKIEAHAYAEEKLCDDVFETPGFGIVGTDTMEPLRKKRNSTIAFEYNQDTRLGDVITYTKKAIWGECRVSYVTFSFLTGEERLYCENNDASFAKLLANYLDPQETGVITLCILVSCNAGTVFAMDQLRFYVHSHEAGKHNEPHVHVRHVDHEHEGTVRISDGEMMEGNLQGRDRKTAQKIILAEQEYFYRCWNTMTDGLSVDINKHLGLIQY